MSMRIDNTYGECVVKRQDTMGGMVCRFGLVGLTSVLVILGLFVQWLLLFAFGAAYLTYAMWNRFHVTYEYVFCDGQIDFDKMLGGESRKHVYRIDMDQVEIVAPENSQALAGYRHLQAKPKDFTSLMKGEGHKVYVIAHKGPQGIELIRFEPDEQMVALMKNKAPRKVQEF